MKRGYLTTRTSKRIGAAVRAFEKSGRNQTPIKFRTGFDDGGGSRLRLCKTTASWTVGTVATLDVWENGTTPDETVTAGETIEATNHLWDVDTDTLCLVMFGGAGANYLVSAFPADSTCEEPGS